MLTCVDGVINHVVGGIVDTNRALTTSGSQNSYLQSPGQCHLQWKCCVKIVCVSLLLTS